MSAAKSMNSGGCAAIPEEQWAQVLEQKGGPVIYKKIPVPKPGPDEVLINIKYSGVCHTDLHAVKGDWPLQSKMPLVGGHEGAGVVVARGSLVKDVEIGDYAGIKWLNGSCLSCVHCRQSNESLCGDATLSGYTVDGSFQQYAIGKAAHVARIPKDYDLEAIAPILCAGLTVYKALKESGARPGQHVAIVGAGGGLGSFAIQYAKAMGLHPIAIDGGGEKRKVCTELGAQSYIDFTTSKDIVEDVKKASCDGLGPHAVLLLAVSEKPFQQASQYIRSKGTIVCVALPANAFIKAPVFDTVIREINIKGSYVGNRQDTAEAIDFFGRGLIKAPYKVVRLSELQTMPLIIITGFPTSGKTTRAKQLHTYITERIKQASSSATNPKYRLHLISDQTLSISRSAYDLSVLPAHTRSANASEKDARASIYGAVKRVLSDRDIVILDGLNYIKGWRYQLFCEAKAVRTPSCVLQVGCSKEKSREVNEERLARRPEKEEGSATADDNTDEEGAYAPENWENLVFRYEEPNAMTRWDSPLFTLIWEDGEEQTKRVFDSLWEAIAGEARKQVKPNQATVQRSRDAGGDYLYNLDRETQDIVKQILDQQSDEGGDEITVSKGNGTGEDLVLELPAGKKIGLPQLQRLRRAFMGLNRGGIGLELVGNLGPGRIRESFVGYLNDAFEKEG
ncbi:hypothetical protein DL762_004009 [Monosporascus cannonballus]|uniref:alcohol dehydrogenase n=1 Tax=Monosporascus cannonballus TaxID=155416 RepID=A0ABY0HA24_9PEZI|nr:hypothetical protein DL762_004009 [Monosporascus cannonballus]